eukprot:scaffold71739_cov69-Phaeocystis_antarctica.AAC.4
MPAAAATVGSRSVELITLSASVPPTGAIPGQRTKNGLAPRAAHVAPVATLDAARVEAVVVAVEGEVVVVVVRGWPIVRHEEHYRVGCLAQCIETVQHDAHPIVSIRHHRRVDLVPIVVQVRKPHHGLPRRQVREVRLVQTEVDVPGMAAIAPHKVDGCVVDRAEVQRRYPPRPPSRLIVPVIEGARRVGHAVVGVG